MRKRIDWAALGIFLIALIPRIIALDLIEFKGDEAFSILAIEQFFQNPHIIQTGLISSAGPRNFPLFHNLLLIPGLISLDPRFISGVIGAVNAFMVVVFYYITKKYFSGRVALVSSLLFATAPWSILFSRKIWAQDLIPLLAVPIYGLLLRLNKTPSHKAQIALWACLILSAQLHASGLFFAIPIVIWLIAKRIATVKAIIIGTAIAGVTALPYVYVQIASKPFCPDCRSLDNGQVRRFDIGHAYVPFTFIGGLNWHQVMGKQNTDHFYAAYPVSSMANLAFVVELIALMTGVIAVVFFEKQHRWLAYLLTGFIGTFFLFQVPAYLFYYQIAVPILMTLAGIGVAAGIKKQPEITWSAVVMVVFANVLFVGMFFHYLAVNRAVAGDYGQVFSNSNKQVEAVVNGYKHRQDYSQIKAVAYASAGNYPQVYENIHSQLALYFFQTNERTFAERELDEVFKLNPSNSFAKKLKSVLTENAVPTGNISQ